MTNLGSCAWSKRLCSINSSRQTNLGATAAWLFAFLSSCVLIQIRRTLVVFGIALERCNNKYGYALAIYRVWKPGHYTRSTKLTVLLAIEPGDPRLPNNVYGSIERPRRWCEVLQSSGTSSDAFAGFIDTICTDIETNGIPGNQHDTDLHRVFYGTT